MRIMTTSYPKEVRGDMDAVARHGVCDSVDQLARALAEAFERHPDYKIITSFPGFAGSAAAEDGRRQVDGSMSLNHTMAAALTATRSGIPTRRRSTESDSTSAPTSTPS